MNRSESGERARLQRERLYALNKQFASDLCDLFTDNGVYFAVGIGIRSLASIRSNPGLDLHLASIPSLDISDDKLKALLHLCQQLVDAENLQVCLADDLPGAVPPREKPKPAE